MLSRARLSRWLLLLPWRGLRRQWLLWDRRKRSGVERLRLRDRRLRDRRLRGWRVLHLARALSDRSCEQPSQEIGDNRRKPEPAAEEKAAGGDREQDEDLGRNHARVPLSRSSLTLEASIVRPGRRLSH